MIETENCEYHGAKHWTTECSECLPQRYVEVPEFRNRSPSSWWEATRRARSFQSRQKPWCLAGMERGLFRSISCPHSKRSSYAAWRRIKRQTCASLGSSDL